MLEEEKLVERAKSGEAEAWAMLYEKYFHPLYRYIASKGAGSTEAEDLTEQVFLKAMHSISSFHWRGAPFSAWLFRIARNLVIDFHRKRAAQRKPLPLPPPPPDPEELVEEKALIGELLQAVGQLTPSQQEVLRLRFAAGLSTLEAARVLGKSPGAVKAQQHSALVALRRILKSHE